ncbi:MAG TPA: cytochrome P450 [Acidimicrobiales bacterium]
MTDPAPAASCPHLEPLLALEPDAIRMSYRHWAELRDEGPVVWVDQLQCFAVIRYEEIVSVVRDPGRFSSRMPTGPKMVNETMSRLQEIMAESPEMFETLSKGLMIGSAPALLNADPPAHDRQRALVNRAFSPPRVRRMEEPIRALANQLVDTFVDRGECEFVHEFAVLLPLTIIAGALGVPDGDLATFKRWSDDFVVAIGNDHLSKDDLKRMLLSQVEFFDYFTDKIEERRAQPQDDLISDVVHAEVEGEEPLTTMEMLGMFSQFLVAGNETTTKLLASTMLRLIEDPELMATVRADRSLIPGLIEEVLRLDTPVQGLFRVADQNCELGGVEIPAGSSLWVLYASANRDDGEFAEPDVLDLGRANAKAHLAFGQGVHYCLGASLARAEGRIGIEILLDRLDDITLADDATIEYEPSYVLHGVRALPITFRAIS